MFIKNFTKIFTKDFTKKHLYISTFIISSTTLILSYTILNNINNKQNLNISSAADTVLMSESTRQNKSNAAIASDNTNNTGNINNTNNTNSTVSIVSMADTLEQSKKSSLKNSTASESSTPLMTMNSSIFESEGIQSAGDESISRGEERVVPEASSAKEILKKGTTSEEVMKLQQNLQKLGFFNAEPTGYFGEITRLAVINFQKSSSLLPDGVAGPQTISLIEEAVNDPQIAAQIAASTATQPSYAIYAIEEPAKGEIQLLPWFGEVENIYSIGSIATVIDVNTGLSMQVKRTYGYNHADVETLTAEDTEILRTVAGGEWNWTRRPVVVEVNGRRIAGSLTAMPHAGRDDMPANAYVDDRSGDYGYGANLDAVKGNDMDGQFDIHFYGSKTHSTNRVDEAHQNAIQKAYDSGL